MVVIPHKKRNLRFIVFLKSQIIKPGFCKVVTVSNVSPRQARGHIVEGCIKWTHILNNVADVADQTGTVRGCIKSR